jgi:hypothetical protein
LTNFCVVEPVLGTWYAFCFLLILETLMKDTLQKGRKLRELKKAKPTPKRATVAETIAERYVEVLRLRQRVLEADTWRLDRR